MPTNERIGRLREKLFASDDRAVFLERRIGLLRAAEKHAGEPAELRHALTFAEILDGMTVVVDPDDLIVGRTFDAVPSDEHAALLEAARDLAQASHFSTGGRITPDWAGLLERGMAGARGGGGRPREPGRRE